MTYDGFTLDSYRGFPRLTLNRPQVHNAVDAALMTAWEQALDVVLDRSDVRALILTGSGHKTFCAGGDLRYFDSLKTRDEGRQMSQRMQAILSRLYDAPFPVIAAINGDAYGGGCEVLTACHIRIAASHARFAFRQAANGVITGWGGGTRLLRQLPRTTVLRLLLTSEQIDANRAEVLGFVNEVVPAADVLDTAVALAQQMADNSALSVSSFLELARVLDQEGEAAAIARETELVVDTWVSEEFRATLARFRK